MARQSSTLLEISRARHGAELVTDDRKALGEHLETATGERVAALEALEPVAERTATMPERAADGVGKATPQSVGPEVRKAPQRHELDLEPVLYCVLGNDTAITQFVTAKRSQTRRLKGNVRARRHP